MILPLLYRLCKRVHHAVLSRWWNISGAVLLRMQGVAFARAPCLYGYPIVSLHKNSQIILDDEVVLCSDSRFTALGVSRPVIMRTLAENALIYIGRDAGLSGTTICAAVSVSIGSSCLIGADVQIFDTDFHKLAPENRRHDNAPDKIASMPVVIGENVFIGAGCKILKGVSIGRNSVIGAGSVVSKDIPANCIAAGNPARVIGQIPLPISG